MNKWGLRKKVIQLVELMLIPMETVMEVMEVTFIRVMAAEQEPAIFIQVDNY